MVRPNLPDFKRPPVNEVALSIQFVSLKRLRAVHLGLLWEHFGRDSFPSTEEHSEVQRTIENLGAPTPSALQIELLNVPPVPRCLFVSLSGTEIVQVQQDRFTYNWRKTSDADTYPRFEAVSSRFIELASSFQAFLKNHGLGAMDITQAEVTYVNRIEQDDAAGQVEKIVSVYSGDFSDKFLQSPEEIFLSLRFPMRQNELIRGRLHVDVRPSLPGVLNSARVITLVARGKPYGSDISSALEFFAFGRQHIVSGFASITSPAMHELWERRDNA